VCVCACVRVCGGEEPRGDLRLQQTRASAMRLHSQVDGEDHLPRIVDIIDVGAVSSPRQRPDPALRTELRPSFPPSYYSTHGFSAEDGRRQLPIPRFRFPFTFLFACYVKQIDIASGTFACSDR
jgi:hypothetical protein